VSDDGSSGDTVTLSNLVSGSYSLTNLSDTTSNMEILNIRGDGANTELTVTGQDIQKFVTQGDHSEIWIKADSGDILKIGDPAENVETRQDTLHPEIIHSTIYSDAGHSQQIAQIHWQTA
jgi:hypothetical protein